MLYQLQEQNAIENASLNLGLTNRELSALTNISAPSLLNIRQGKPFRSVTAKKIYDVFGDDVKIVPYKKQNTASIQRGR